MTTFSRYQILTFEFFVLKCSSPSICQKRITGVHARLSNFMPNFTSRSLSTGSLAATTPTVSQLSCYGISQCSQPPLASTILQHHSPTFGILQLQLEGTGWDMPGTRYIYWADLPHCRKSVTKACNGTISIVFVSERVIFIRR